MRKRKVNLPGLVRLKRPHLPKRLITASIAIIIVFLFALAYLDRALKTCDYFRITSVFVNENNISDRGNQKIDLSYLKGRNIFSVNLRKESEYLARQYPGYRKVRLIRVLPDRIFADFLQRKPVAILRLSRYLCVDEEGVTFEFSGGIEEKALPYIWGLEIKIFDARPGKKYNIKELALALEVIKEFKLSKALRLYKVSRIDVASPSSASFFMLFPTPALDSLKPPAPAQATAEGAQVKIGADEIKKKIHILGGLLTQAKFEPAKIKYIDLRFKEPVIKLK